MKAAIIQSNYIPWKGYFDIINTVDVFCFYDEVKYTKNDWRNRNIIYSKNGQHWITIPIPKEAVNHKICETKILDKKWQNLHYKMLESSYRGAPYYDQLEFFMNELYVKREWEFLSQLNQYSIKLVCSFIGIETIFTDSSNYSLTGERVVRLINLLKDIGATEYISGPSAKEYLNASENLFNDNNIKLVYKDYSGYTEYKQLRTPFEHCVTIFDVIANVEKSEILRYITPVR